MPTSSGSNVVAVVCTPSAKHLFTTCTPPKIKSLQLPPSSNIPSWSFYVSKKLPYSFPQPPTSHSLPIFVHGLINSFFTEQMEVIRQELSKHHLALEHSPGVPTARFVSSTLSSHGLGEKGISLFTFSPLFLNPAPSGILSLQRLPCFSYYGFFSLAQFWISTPPRSQVPAIPEGAQFSNALISLQSLYPSLMFLFPCHPSLKFTILVLSCSSKDFLPPGLPQSSGAQPLSTLHHTSDWV